MTKQIQTYLWWSAAAVMHILALFEAYRYLILIINFTAATCASKTRVFVTQDHPGSSLQTLTTTRFKGC